MSTVVCEPLVTVWWIITPCTGPHAPLLLRLWSRQLPTSTTVRPSAFRALRKPLADRGCAMGPPGHDEAPGPGRLPGRVGAGLGGVPLRGDAQVPAGGHVVERGPEADLARRPDRAFAVVVAVAPARVDHDGRAPAHGQGRRGQVGPVGADPAVPRRVAGTGVREVAVHHHGPARPRAVEVDDGEVRRADQPGGDDLRGDPVVHPLLSDDHSWLPQGHSAALLPL